MFHIGGSKNQGGDTHKEPTRVIENFKCSETAWLAFTNDRRKNRSRRFPRS